MSEKWYVTRRQKNVVMLRFTPKQMEKLELVARSFHVTPEWFLRTYARSEMKKFDGYAEASRARHRRLTGCTLEKSPGDLAKEKRDAFIGPIEVFEPSEEG